MAPRRLNQPLPLRWAGLAALSLALAAPLHLAGLPAALLLGPMLVAVAFAVGGAGLSMPPLPFRLAQALVGCMIARVLTADVLAEIARDWPIFAAGVTAVIVASSALGWILARLAILPGTTAIWGSSPGAASAMTLMSESFGADMRLVAFMQYTRVVIVATVAAMVARISGASAAGAAAAVLWLAAPDWPWLAATLLLAGGSAVAGRLLPIPAAPLLIPLVLGVLLQDMGLLQIELPPLLLALAYAVVGWGVGLRFDPAVVVHARRALPAVLASVACLVVVCAGFAGVLVVLAGVDPLSAYLAMSPGGADAVAIIAASADVDTAFVMAMQTARLLVLLIVGPFIARALARHAVPRRPPPPGG